MNKKNKYSKPKRLIIVFNILCTILLILLWPILFFDSRRGRVPVEEQLLKMFEPLMKAARSRDYETLLDRYSLNRVAECRKLKGRLLADNPGMSYPVCWDAPNDDLARELTRMNLQLFLDSYGDLLNGKPARVCFSGVYGMESAELFSILIYVEMSGKYHGIIIDAVRIKGKCLRVVEWARLSKGISCLHTLKWRAKITRDSLEECTFPRIIDYEYLQRRASGAPGISTIFQQ